MDNQKRAGDIYSYNFVIFIAGDNKYIAIEGDSIALFKGVGYEDDDIWNNGDYEWLGNISDIVKDERAIEAIYEGFETNFLSDEVKEGIELAREDLFNQLKAITGEI